MSFLILGIAVCLLIVFFQDLKQRQIHVFLPIVIFFLSLTIFYSKSLAFQTLLITVGFLLVTLLIMVLYMSLKNKSFLNPFANYFGIGDLLFFISITPLFVTYNYILYFIFSMLFSVVVQLVFVSKIKTVPLAGFSSLFLLLVIIKDLLFDFNPITIL